jgi:hypothetical protein
VWTATVRKGMKKKRLTSAIMKHSSAVLLSFPFSTQQKKAQRESVCVLLRVYRKTDTKKKERERERERERRG